VDKGIINVVIRKKTANESTGIKVGDLSNVVGETSAAKASIRLVTPDFGGV